MPTKHFLLAFFSIEGQAQQAFAALRQNVNAPIEELYVREATLLKRTHHEIIEKEQMYGYLTPLSKNDMPYTISNRILKTVNGPIGQLLLQRHLSPIDAQRNKTENLLLAMSQGIHENCYGILAAVEETNPKKIHQLFKQYDMTLIRYEESYILEELKAAASLEALLRSQVQKSIRDFEPENLHSALTEHVG
ncbi:hypothetical protein [Kurthia senegalensis]|uniref:hypothetical protein n=1 Tax=Kurthia senegalensis TaxID=1033740 RepID=UPI00028884B2|nr:hypothetical protein [Kurthia senegalensis]